VKNRFQSLPFKYTTCSATTRLVRLWRREEKLPPEERTRADQLRIALSALGPVFVKIGQTLSQRADLIGDEAADSLKALQQSNAPFPVGLYKLK
jgi:predicted unusual protein kinase regulating ubiquinone biosynthesis (AarF/ABC1/UbiB family)